MNDSIASPMTEELDATLRSGELYEFADLRGVSLPGADLQEVILWCPDLSGANLRGTNLVATSLVNAFLEKADLTEANLTRANLSDAQLQTATFIGAVLEAVDLRRANLTGADLRHTCLKKANLQCANLSGVDLTDADLTHADLTSAYLRGANLTKTNLSSANLDEIRRDFLDVLTQCPQDFPGLKLALEQGRIDGDRYLGQQACLIGTLAKLKGTSPEQLPLGLQPNAARPIEMFFSAIGKGDTPQNNPVCALVLNWMEES
ncbi:MAG: pentapeptide repeat-containing protein [Cyanobacteriota bacterium]